MFHFFKRNDRDKQLDAIISKIQMNMENNYKDAAQLNLKEFEGLLREFEDTGRLNDKQREYYEEELKGLKERMKNFTHKDQKPYWV